jgi:2-polyprenyl-3-methyl-5-hydroxy-6-metoxy-1,4-benzoquinol methylase
MDSQLAQFPITLHCPFCSSGDIHDTSLRALEDTSRRLYLVYECEACTGRFVADRPTSIDKVQEDAAETFASPERIAQQRAHFAWKRIFDENDYPYSLIPLIQRWAPGQRVLDLGCGASQLLPMLKSRGFDVVGFEGDPARAEVARENGVTIVSGDWRTIGDRLGGKRFDCIVSDQVFEHMLDPVDTLRSLKSLLTEDGVLIFRFPNEGSWRRKTELAWARLRGNNRPLSYFVDHWNYFNERAARTCFTSADYEVLRIKKDLSLHGFLVRKVFPNLAAVPGLPQLIARTIASIDSNALSNGLTVVSRPLQRAA